MNIPEMNGEHQGGEDDEVLHPLVWAHGGEDVSHCADAIMLDLAAVFGSVFKVILICKAIS